MDRQEMVLPVIDKERCDGCGACVSRCPAGAVQLVDGEVVFQASERCTYCGVCEDVCPAGAVALYYEVALAAVGG
jgi:NAD-dependent dihydropyrimidine dehydrogenase PreA subunit